MHPDKLAQRGQVVTPELQAQVRKHVELWVTFCPQDSNQALSVTPICSLATPLLASFKE